MKASRKETLSPINGILVAALLVAIMAIGSGPAFAGGANLHFFVGQQSVDRIQPNGNIKELIHANYDAFKLGLLFPDLPHAILDTDRSDPKWKEHKTAKYLHSPDFLNDYASAIIKNCKNIGLKKCNEVKAHYFGVIGHITFDLTYDNNFVKEVKAKCSYSGVGKAAILADQSIDRAAFDTIPGTAFGIRNPFVIQKVPGGVRRKDREARRHVIKQNTVAKAKNIALEKKRKDARRAHWGKTRPSSPRPDVITFLSKHVLKDNAEIKFGKRNISKTFNRALEKQWKVNVKGETVGRLVGKSPPHTAQTVAAWTLARRQCPWAIEYANWNQNVWNSASYLSKFMQIAWKSMEQGQRPVFSRKGGNHWQHRLCIGGVCTEIADR